MTSPWDWLTIHCTEVPFVSALARTRRIDVPAPVSPNEKPRAWSAEKWSDQLYPHPSASSMYQSTARAPGVAVTVLQVKDAVAPIATFAESGGITRTSEPVSIWRGMWRDVHAFIQWCYVTTITYTLPRSTRSEREVLVAGRIYLASSCS